MSSIQNRGAQAGFTLHELMVTLVIIGGLSGAATAFGGMVQNHRIVAEVNTFVAELSLARSEAIKRGQRVTLCPSIDGKGCDAATDFAWWHNGAILFTDANANGRVDSGDEVVRVHSPQSGVSVKSSRFRKKIVFQPNGMSGGSNFTFTVCAGNGAADARYVILSINGRTRIASAPPDGRADQPLERCA